MFDRDRRLFAKDKNPDNDETPADPAAKGRSHRFARDDVDATTARTPTEEAPGHDAEHAKEAPAPKPQVTAEQSTERGIAAFEDAERKYAAKDFAGALAGYTTAWDASVISAAERGQVAFNIAQCHRRLEQTQLAIVWYRTALISGGVEERRAEIEGHLKTLGQYVEANVGADAKYNEAQQLYASKQYAAAAAAYLEAWEQPGLGADARGPLAFDRAQCLRALGQHENAITWYRLALQIGGPTLAPNRSKIEELIVELGGKLPSADEAAAMPSKEARFDEAEALFQRGAWSQAVVVYLEVWERVAAEDRGAIAYNIAQCYRHEQEYGRALTWYQTALSSGGPLVEEKRTKIEGYLGEAKERFEAGAGKAASPADLAGKAAVRANRIDDVRVTFEAAEEAYRLGDYAAALPLYMQVWESDLGSHGALAFNIGQCYRKLGQITQAIAWIESGLAEGTFTEDDTATAKAMVAELRQQIGAAPVKG